MVGTLEPVLWHKTVWRRGHFSPCLWWWEQFFERLLKDLSFSSNSIPSQYWKEVLTFFNWKNPPWRVKKASPCFQGRWRSRSSVFFPSRSWKLVFRLTSLWSECQNSTSHVAGVSILVGYRKQSKSLEESHVRLSVFPKTKLLLPKHLATGCILVRADWRKCQPSFKPQGSV